MCQCSGVDLDSLYHNVKGKRWKKPTIRELSGLEKLEALLKWFKKV